MTFAPDPRKLPTAADVVAKFKAENYDPEGYTLYTYAAIQAYRRRRRQGGLDRPRGGGQGAEARAATRPCSARWRSTRRATSKNPEYVMYVWKDGQYGEL